MSKHLFFDQAHHVHIKCAESSTNTTNGYYEENNVIGCLDLQVMQESINFVWCYLVCQQLMHFFLITGLKSYQSLWWFQMQYFLGLEQDSGGASSMWLAVKMIIIQAFKNVGYHTTFQSSWSSLP